MAYDQSKIKKNEFDGKFHKLSAAHQTHPSPQRVLVMFQAGSSKAGIAFAGGHAEGVFSGSLIPSHTAKHVKEIRTAAKESSRDPKFVKAFPGIHCLLHQLSKKHS
jgi:alkanesulfonate monooxygenase SsuD/methylene tetrahydromethanopterin reductase-like flavin-dependent oxidoreductase (luciferase family)